MTKKILYILIIITILTTMLFSITGCSSKEDIVNLTVPSMYMEGKTQEDLDALAKEKGYKAITLNEDGSAVYVMTKSQHNELLKELKETCDKSIKDMIKSESYPNFIDIKANDNYTDFTITTTSESLDLSESLSTLVFYMYGGMYSVFTGEEVDNVHVKFVQDGTGKVLHEANSNKTSDN